MSMTTMQMYWLVMLDSINIGSVFVCIIFGVCIFSMIGFAVDSCTCPTFVKVCAPLFMLFFLVSFATCVFLPSTKQMAAIMIVPKIVNNEKVQTIGNKVYDLAVEWMDELKPKKKSEVKR